MCVCDCVTPRGMRKQVAVRCGEISLPLPWEQGNTSNPHSAPLASYRPLPRLNQVLQPTFSSPGLVQALRFLQHHHIFSTVSSPPPALLIAHRCVSLSPANPSFIFSFLLLLPPLRFWLKEPPPQKKKNLHQHLHTHIRTPNETTPSLVLT